MMRSRTKIAPAATHSSINDCWNKIGVRGDSSCPELEKHIHCRNCPVYSAAAVELLDTDSPADYLALWSRQIAQKKELKDLKTLSAVIFRIGAEWLALPTSIFNEVAELRTIHSLPNLRSGIVLGVANVRGELLTCVSLGRLLGLEKAEAPKQAKHSGVHSRLLVISQENQRLVFPVNEVHGIYRYRPGVLKAVPATVTKATATYTKAMLPWQDKSVGCLDDQLLFYTLNRSLT